MTKLKYPMIFAVEKVVSFGYFPLVGCNRQASGPPHHRKGA